MKQYRKFYEKTFNIKLSKFYEIHHIDKNRDNNNIFNLVAIPRNLHNKYHSCYSKLLPIISTDIFNETNFNLSLECFQNELEEYLNYKLSIIMFIRFRNTALQNIESRWYSKKLKEMENYYE